MVLCSRNSTTAVAESWEKMAFCAASLTRGDVSLYGSAAQLWTDLRAYFSIEPTIALRRCDGVVLAQQYDSCIERMLLALCERNEGYVTATYGGI